MFYDTKIDILYTGNGYKDEYGIWHDGELVSIKNIDCDIQPITKEISMKVFGISENVKYRIFCNVVDSIDIGTIIQYNNKLYRVISLLEWDYFDFIVGDYDEQ